MALGGEFIVESGVPFMLRRRWRDGLHGVAMAKRLDSSPRRQGGQRLGCVPSPTHR